LRQGLWDEAAAGMRQMGAKVTFVTWAACICWQFAICFMFYNFCRIRKTLRVTPAMEAGIAASCLDD
jgi:hypothetical protein